MNPASLRIKFTPLLKLINNDDAESKCCIEILPELSGFKNLNKIHWQVDDDLMEYTLPMTYKILIKKQNEKKSETGLKMYHSCVDLLHAYSVSNTDLASGDDTRIISDNFVPMKYCSSMEICDDNQSMKDPLDSRESYQMQNKCKSASIQTLEINEQQNSSLSSQRPLIDKCFGANLNDDSISKTNNKVTLRKNTSNVDGNIKREKATETIEIAKENKNIIAQSDSVDSLNARLNAFSKKASQCKLSLSPICSLSTYDGCLFYPVYSTKNTSSYTFRNTNASNGSILNKNFDTSRTKFFDDSTVIKNVSYDYKTVDEMSQFYKAETNVTVERMKKTTDTLRYKTIKSMLSNIISIKDISTSMSKIIDKSNRSNICNKHINAFQSQNSSKIPTNYKSVDMPKYSTGKHIKNYERKKKSNDSLINAGDGRVVCKVDNQRKNARTPPEIRVAQILQKVEKEIYPLNLMLSEIRCKCVTLGLDLFFGEFRHSQKSLLYKPVSNSDCKPKDTYYDRKSNRVVYTVLYNG